LLARRADTVWSELAGIRAAALGMGGVVEATGLVSADSELGRLLRSERPIRHLCLAALEEGRTALVLGRVSDPFTRRELELVRLSLPVIGLGDRRASEVQEALGARLTPREQEIFDYVSRGYNNREIASALGTSHFTVRNQLCRLFRKVGVSGRSELVGLAAMATRRARTA
jgi:DNA-binding CsgD family transcriptional regulator